MSFLRQIYSLLPRRPTKGAIADQGEVIMPVKVAVVCLCACVIVSEVAAREDLSKSDAARVAAVIAPTEDFSTAERFENMAGGAGTSLMAPDKAAFTHPSRNLPLDRRQDFALGDALFKKLWVSAPSSTQASDGLGPLYNARSCLRCHVNDGRGRPPMGQNDPSPSLLIRFSLQQDDHADTFSLHRGPDPIYGRQLQNLALPGMVVEGRMALSYEPVLVHMNGGETVELRRPRYSITDLGHGPLHEDTVLSPRVAPPMIGLGLLEAIHPSDIRAKADPDDRDGDGISGRINLVLDRASGQESIGRFGWKAGAPSVMQQSADAFAGDIGISTPLASDPHGDCTPAQHACRAMVSGVQESLGRTEAPDPILELVTFYSANLAVPTRRDVDDAEVLQGKAIFYQAGCTACHTPKFVTSRNAARAEHRFQLIWPYTDLLLHDMGEGLADRGKRPNTENTEWRTPPLWGIGLTKTVGGHNFYLHDGRARSLTEAILWHGGEAQAARDRFVALRPADRQFLIRFLESL